MLRFIAPLLVFGVMVGFFYVGLQKDPRELPSALIDKPAPGFELAQLHRPELSFGPEQMRGRVWALNVWASWCAACRSEHPLFMELARNNELNLIGLNYKDRAVDAKQWLVQLGDPYELSAADVKGHVGIDYGVYGVPETFIIDKQGVIRHKHVGPVSRQEWLEEIKPLIAKLEQE